MGTYLDLDVFDHIIEEIQKSPTTDPVEVVRNLKLKYEKSIINSYEVR